VFFSSAMTSILRGELNAHSFKALVPEPVSRPLNLFLHRNFVSQAGLLVCHKSSDRGIGVTFQTVEKLGVRFKCRHRRSPTAVSSEFSYELSKHRHPVRRFLQQSKGEFCPLPRMAVTATGRDD